MIINRIKIHLEKTFITKALDKETLIKVISGEHPSILHRLYLITNELKEEQHFMELEHPELQCSAKIKTKYGYSGSARTQAATIGFMKNKLKEQPKYTILFKIYEKVGMQNIFEFKHETTNVNDLLNMINKLETKTKELCQSRVNTY